MLTTERNSKVLAEQSLATMLINSDEINSDNLETRIKSAKQKGMISREDSRKQNANLGKEACVRTRSPTPPFSFYF